MTTDLLFALILVIFSLGTLIGISELRMYELKEDMIYKDVLEKSEAGLIVLSGGGLVGCEDGNGLFLPFSFDETKKSLLTKKNLGLEDYNVILKIDNETVFTDNLNDTKNVISTKISLVKCVDKINNIREVKNFDIIFGELSVGR